MYWLRAVAFFGHSPVYLVDKDAFYHGLRGWGCDWIVFGAMLLALALPVWLFVLMHPSGWYRGRHGLRFYGVVTLSVITIGFAIVRDITEDVVILAEPKQIRVESHIDPHVEILGDAVRLHQALLNVIENAIKYTPAGGTVVVALHAQDHEALVTVRDTGSGIPEDQIHRIFDRFFRVDKARSSNIHGTGLGLAIVQWVVRSHEGSVRVESVVGEGTTFVLSFPRHVVGHASRDGIHA